jgi:hypothetical protein
MNHEYVELQYDGGYIASSLLIPQRREYEFRISL